MALMLPCVQMSRGIESVRLTSQGLHTTQWNLAMAFLKPQVGCHSLKSTVAFKRDLCLQDAYACKPNAWYTASSCKVVSPHNPVLTMHQLKARACR